MKKAALFIIEGFEETEAVGTADILRRGDVDLSIVSLTSSLSVQGKHNIIVTADSRFGEISNKDFDMLVIPGGTIKYIEHSGLIDMVMQYNAAHKHLAAICAAPAVFGSAGILKGKKATIYPGMESYLGEGAVFVKERVVTDGNITTSRGPGATLYFALKLVEILSGKETAARLKKDILLDE